MLPLIWWIKIYNRKSYYDLSNGAIFNDLERPLSTVSRSRHFWRWISQKRYDIQTNFQWNTNRDLRPTVSFRMTLSDFEWLSKIFHDKKGRAVSLRQLSAELLVFESHTNYSRATWRHLYRKYAYVIQSNLTVKKNQPACKLLICKLQIS